MNSTLILCPTYTTMPNIAAEMLKYVKEEQKRASAGLSTAQFIRQHTTPPQSTCFAFGNTSYKGGYTPQRDRIPCGSPY